MNYRLDFAYNWNSRNCCVNCLKNIEINDPIFYVLENNKNKYLYHWDCFFDIVKYELKCKEKQNSYCFLCDEEINNETCFQIYEMPIHWSCLFDFLYDIITLVYRL